MRRAVCFSPGWGKCSRSRVRPLPRWARGVGPLLLRAPVGWRFGALWGGCLPSAGGVGGVVGGGEGVGGVFGFGGGGGGAAGLGLGHYLRTFFLPATVFFGPLRVRALVWVRWPWTGRPRRWRMPW